jgi:hypothetical protein
MLLHKIFVYIMWCVCYISVVCLTAVLVLSNVRKLKPSKIVFSSFLIIILALSVVGN